jgi:nitroreductase
LNICRDFEVLELNQSWGGGTGLRKFAEKAVRASSGFALLSMPRSSANAYFQGGRAMQRAWLAACAQKLAVHPMSALLYLFARLRADPDSLPEWFAHSLADLWPSYARLFNASECEAGVLLFRIAQPVGAMPPAAPRRPVSQVLRFL